jgi:hypothetical protein
MFPALLTLSDLGNTKTAFTAKAWTADQIENLIQHARVWIDKARRMNVTIAYADGTIDSQQI